MSEIDYSFGGGQLLGGTIEFRFTARMLDQ